MKIIIAFNSETLDYQICVMSNGFEIHNFRLPYEKLKETKKQLAISLQNQLAEINIEVDCEHIEYEERSYRRNNNY